MERVADCLELRSKCVQILLNISVLLQTLVQNLNNLPTEMTLLVAESAENHECIQLTCSEMTSFVAESAVHSWT